ncbi:MAG: TonB-dependent receptor, partial [Verrucomicrobiaceae bacterium]
MFFRSPLLLALGTATLSAHDIASELTPMIVSGKAEFMLGGADTASKGQTSREELLERPWLRKGELLESVPGVIIT